MIGFSAAGKFGNPPRIVKRKIGSHFMRVPKNSPAFGVFPKKPPGPAPWRKGEGSELQP